MNFIRIGCPTCHRACRSVFMMRSATQAINRTCPKGHRWRVVITPIKHSAIASAHRIDWTPMADAARCRG